MRRQVTDGARELAGDARARRGRAEAPGAAPLPAAAAAPPKVTTLHLALTSGGLARRWEASLWAAAKEADAGRDGLGDEPTAAGYRSIWKAAQRGDVHTVRALVETHKVDPNVSNPYGNNALYLSAVSAATHAQRHGLKSVEFAADLKVIQYLLSKGGDPYRRNELGLNALDAVANRTVDAEKLRQRDVDLGAVGGARATARARARRARARALQTAHDALVRLLRMTKLECACGPPLSSDSRGRAPRESPARPPLSPSLRYIDGVIGASRRRSSASSTRAMTGRATTRARPRVRSRARRAAAAAARTTAPTACSRGLDG